MDVLLSTDELTVLGGPEKIELEVDFGPEGDRGSQIFVGNGNPNDDSTVIGQDPVFLDLYINLLTSDPEYLFVYQYQNIFGEGQWIKLFKLIPNIYSTNRTTSFIDGQGSINIPVINIVPSELVGTITASNFNIQHNLVNNSSPISSSLSVGEIVTVDDLVTLPIFINAIEFDGESWINVSGNKTVHLFISVV
jgi:hypothetical protein